MSSTTTTTKHPLVDYKKQTQGHTNVSYFHLPGADHLEHNGMEDCHQRLPQLAYQGKHMKCSLNAPNTFQTAKYGGLL